MAHILIYTQRTPQGIHPGSMKDYFEQFAATKYLLVVRPEADRFRKDKGEFLVDADVFLYEVESGESRGGIGIDVSWDCNSKMLVVVGGPRSGQSGGATKCETKPMFEALHGELKAAIPDITLPEMPK